MGCSQVGADDPQVVALREYIQELEKEAEEGTQFKAFKVLIPTVGCLDWKWFFPKDNDLKVFIEWYLDKYRETKNSPSTQMLLEYFSETPFENLTYEERTFDDRDAFVAFKKSKKKS